MNRSRRALSLVASLGLAACGSRSHEAPAEPKVEGSSVSLPSPSPQLSSLATEPAREAKLSALRLNGRTAWDDDATVRVYSAFAGHVSRIDVQIGQYVHRGDVLAELASPDYAQAEADANRAASELRLAERTVARARDLFDHGAAAQRDVDAAEADLERAKAERERTSARLSAYGGKTGGAVVGTFALRAPIDGDVVERNLTPGQEVRPDQILAGTPALTAPLFTITDPTRLWVVLDVSEHDAPELHAGQPCVVRPHLAEGEFAGSIASVSAFLDPITRSVKARASLPNPDRALRAEMLVTVEVAPAEEKTVQEVPARAVFLEGEKHFVFVASGGGRFERKPVEIGAEREGRLQIREGLPDGASVVTDGALLLEKIYRDGTTGS